jgi:alkyl hydroperoxide reductase subunit AhpF
LDQDLHLEVFVTPTCPYCPQAVRLAQEMARINPDRIMADMVDCSTFSRLATRLNVMGVPMTLINGHERITGAAPEAQVMDAIRESLPQSL